MVGVSTSLGAQAALNSQNRPAVEQTEVAKTQPVSRGESTPESARADAPSPAFQLSEAAQGVVVTSSESAQAEKDSAGRDLVEQVRTELVQFFTELYHRDFGYTVADATRKAYRIVGKAEKSLAEIAHNMTQRLDRSGVDKTDLAYMVRVEAINLRASQSGYVPEGADPEALLPKPAGGNDASQYARLRDTKISLQLEVRHQTGNPTFIEPTVIDLVDDGGHVGEPLIDLSSDAWAARISSLAQEGTLQLSLGRIVPLGLGQPGGSAEDLIPGSENDKSANAHYDVVA